MKRNRFGFFLVITIMVLALSSCSGKALPEGFDEAAVKAAAEETIMKMSARDFKTISEKMVRADLREALSQEVLENAFDIMLKDAGTFKSIGTENLTGQKTDTGENFVVAQVLTEYENKKIIYTLSFDKNMEIIGFYMK